MIQRYEELIPVIRAVARSHGYAIGVHGSGERDLDLIAVPWIEDASPADALVEAIRQTVNGLITQGDPDGDFTGRNPTPKPHGRLAWAIRPLDRNPEARLYIDLSVMPRSGERGTE